MVLSGAILVLSATAKGVVAQAGAGGYLILYGAVAASWIGVPIVGASFLAAAGVLASDGELNLWLVITVATVAAWTGGYVGYLIGARAGRAIASRPGRWRHQRRHAMTAGERIYTRWGPVAVFVTPTWVSGALGMPRVRFLAWNALAATASTLIATLGAYGIGTAVLGQLSARRGTTALVIAALACVTVIVLIVRHRRTAGSQDTK